MLRVMPWAHEIIFLFFEYDNLRAFRRNHDKRRAVTFASHGIIFDCDRNLIWLAFDFFPCARHSLSIFLEP